MAPRQDPLGDNPVALREALDLQARGVAVHTVWELLKEKHGIIINERTLHRRLKRGIFGPADRRTGLAGLVSEASSGQAMLAGAVLTVGGSAAVHDAERERARVIADKLLATKKPQWGPLILGLERLRFEYLRLGSGKGAGDSPDDTGDDAKATLRAKLAAPIEDDTGAPTGGEEAGDAPQDAEHAADGE
jgi:hypothetical protein